MVPAMLDAPKNEISLVTVPAPVMFWAEDNEMERKAKTLEAPTEKPLLWVEPSITKVLVPVMVVGPV